MRRERESWRQGWEERRAGCGTATGEGARARISGGDDDRSDKNSLFRATPPARRLGGSPPVCTRLPPLCLPSPVELLDYLHAVTKNQSEKVMTKIVDFVSGSSDMDFLERCGV